MNDIQQQEFNILKKKVDGIERTTDKIYQALVGSDLTKDGGLVAKINEIEKKQDDFVIEIEGRISLIEKAYTKWKGIAIGAGAAGGIIGFLLKIIIDNYLKK